MAKINIISNISSKKHAGTPFYTLDNKKNHKIINDEIVFSIDKEYVLQIGYLYTGSERLVNYEGRIYAKEDEEWYKYKVPLLIDGKGKLKKISQKKFKLEKQIRKYVNNLFFLVFILLTIFVIFLMVNNY